MEKNHNPSLSIKLANERILVHCFAGCPTSDVVHTLGLTIKDLYPNGYQSEEDILHNEMEPIADQLYNAIWGPLESIDRLTHNHTGDVHPLDKEWAIDVVLHTKMGLPITIQDKFRNYYYYKLYNQFTLEYENDPQTHEPGEFFHLVANYYFYGFATANKQSFISWKVIDLNQFKECYRIGVIAEDGIGQNQKKGKANFMWFEWGNLRQQHLLFRDSEALNG